MFNPKNNDNLTANLLPGLFQSDANKKFLQATLDQLVRPGEVQKVNGLIGRQTAKATTGKDVYVEATDKNRTNYQLEPAITIQDNLGNYSFFKDYQDYINELSIFGSNTSHHGRINKQEFYSWNPHIDWDKFSNFQQYYWLPYGPDIIDIAGQQLEVISSYEVKIENLGLNNQWILSPDGLTPNPLIKLYRGQTYIFIVDSPAHPFTLSTVRSVDPVILYETPGLDNNRIESGTITFTVPFDAPDILYYFSANDLNCGGVFQILSIEENSFLDVEKDILGKKQYILPDGLALSNGMKVRFIGNVVPEIYKSQLYYVEGVGKGISLIEERSLEIISPYVNSQEVLFDTELFDSLPFSSSAQFGVEKDYITINRASKDKNPWSRYNRWFHKDVIETSARINGVIPNLDQSSRAVRPIIEFEDGLQLHNFGNYAPTSVDLIDDFTIDVFSTIEGSLGYNVDGIDLMEGQHVLFTADTDSLVRGNIYRVTFVNVQGRKQIHLEHVHSPNYNDVVVIKNGVKNQSVSYWYDGSNWSYAQQKTKVNQQPLFDVVDSLGVSFSDTNKYPGSTFKGTQLFSYAVGTGVNDIVLGFPLTYKNISNIGDIVFNFNIVNDSFIYKSNADIVTKEINVGFLKTYVNNEPKLVNGWEKCVVSNVQAAVRIYKNSNLVNNFDLDIFDNVNDLDDLVVKVYVNGIRLDNTDYQLLDGDVYKTIHLNDDITLDDVLTIKAYTKQVVNNNGFYEIPHNLQNNPLNNEISTFTLGEVLDHVESIIENLVTYKKDITGSSNLRDLGDVSKYGTKFVQHSGPLSLSLYHVTSKTSNVLKAVEKAKNDYIAFKRKFINLAITIGEDVTSNQAVDTIMRKLNENKSTSDPYYFSDMVPYGGSIVSTINVLDSRIKTYPLSQSFDLNYLSSKAVLVYLNGTQLTYGIDYTFDFTNSNFIITDDLVFADGDVFTTYEFESTNGSYVPETPSKLGLYPAYEPEIFLDNTLLTPKQMIRGHDGSMTLAYGDYRDQILLELEKRIFNNIKVKYDSTIFDIYDLLPGYNRNTDYSLTEYNEVVSNYFNDWAREINVDYSTAFSFDASNPFTYNYSGNYAPDGRAVPGFWRGIYKWMFDTDKPHTHPWEMLGFTFQPSWWTKVYGPAPYTRNNLILWNDLSEGIVREPNKPIKIYKNFARPLLKNNIPVDEDGNLLSPYNASIARGTITTNISNEYVFGDIGPAENAWRRSSHYPFIVLLSSILLQPAKTLGVLFDRSRIVRNPADQLVYSDTFLRISPNTLKIGSVYSSTEEVFTAGLVNYLVNYSLSETLESYNNYKNDLSNISPKLSYRLEGFSTKDKFDIILESRTPISATSSVFVPKENYNLFLNTSSPIRKLVYSGVIVTKVVDGYVISGYSKDQSYFNYYDYLNIGNTVNVGGISESYVEWTEGNTYYTGQIVRYNKLYYRVTSPQSLVTTFDERAYAQLKALPYVGGVNSNFRTKWNKSDVLKLLYGKKLSKIQDVVDFLLGYGEYLKDQGFVFDDYNDNLNVISNWETSAKEFLFWTTQKWSVKDEKWQDWSADKSFEYNEVVRYNGEYYQALQAIPATSSTPVVNLPVQGQNKDYQLITDNVNGIYIGMGVTGSGIGNGVVVQSIVGNGPYTINLSEKNIGTVTSATFTGFFNGNLFLKLQGLDTVGSSVLSLSPAANKITLKHEYSVVNSVIDSFYEYSVFKVDGTPLPPQFLNIYRNGGLTSITPVSDDGIYNVTIQLIQQEHVLVLDNVTMFNDIIYNPETGYRRERLKITGYKSIDWNGGLNVPGFIIDRAIIQEWEPWKDYYLGEVVLYQQFYYSANKFIAGSEKFSVTDEKGNINWTKLDSAPEAKMIPNWNYRVTQFTDFYNVESDNFDTQQQDLSQHLIGYQKRQYLENIIQDSVSEFKFYQGMIFDKGTKNAFDKLFGAIRSEEFNGLEFFEEWAVRSGQYGSANSFETIEFVLNEEDFNKRNPQGYQLVNQTVKSSTDFVNRVSPNELFAKPNKFSPNLWETKNNYKPYLRTAGYVRPGEAAVLVKSLEELVTVDVNTLTQGDYIWCGFEKNSWNIYRVNGYENIINNVVYLSNKLTITFDNVHRFAVNDFIGFRESVNFDGFHKISEVTPTAIVINIQLTNSPDSPYPHLKNIIAFYLSPQRAPSINVADSVFPEEIKPGELLWTDDNGNGLWSAWQNNPVYNGTEIFYANPTKDLGFGREIAISKNGRIAALSTFTGQVLIYFKPSSASSWVQRDAITDIEIAKSNVFEVNPNDKKLLATVLALSDDGNYLAVGSPNAGFACTKYKEQWSALVTYNKNEIVKDNNKFYKSLVDSNTNNSTNNTTFWKETYYISVDLTGTNSTLTNHGAVTLYKKDANNLFSLVDTILSPNFSQDEQFGDTLYFSQEYDASNFLSYTLHVGAQGYGQGVGKVYEIKYEQILQASAAYNPYGSSSRAIISINVDEPGRGYTVPPTVIIPSPTESNGIQASAVCTIGVASIKIVQSGAGYLPGDLLYVAGGTFTSPAILKVTAVNSKIQQGNIGEIRSVSIFSRGQYTIAPDITANIITGGTGNNARFDLEIGVSSVTVIDPGAEYSAPPFINFSGSGSGAKATALIGTVISLSSTANISRGMNIRGQGLISSQTVLSVLNGNTIVANINPSSIPFGNLEFTTSEWSYEQNGHVNSPSNQIGFGFSISVHAASDTLIVSSKGEQFGGNVVAGKVNIYKKINNVWTISQTLSNQSTQNVTSSKFGSGIDIDPSGLYLAIGDMEETTKFLNDGSVYIFKRNSFSENFVLFQKLNNVKPQPNGYFGTRVAWMNGNNTLVVFSKNSDIEQVQTFDTYKEIYPNSQNQFGSDFVLDPNSGKNENLTTFDGGATEFKSVVRNNGRVDIYDRYDINYIYSETLEDLAEVNSQYGDGFGVGSDSVLIGAPYAHVNSTMAGRVFAFNKKENQLSWKIIHEETPKIDLTKFKKAFVYNKVTGNLVSYLDIIDPMQGKIPGVAEQELRYKTFYDPAIYTNGNSTVNVSEGQAWGEKQVGQLWWDLRTAKFIDTQDDDVVYRNNSWAVLFPGASIDIYEWVSSSLTPTQWNNIADTVAGLAQNISGQTLYDDSVYSRTQKYNNLTKSYKNTYYFWVKNKNVIPNVLGRSMSAANISKLIANPRGENYKFLAITGSDSFSLANLKSVVEDNNTILAIEYWTTDKPDQVLVHRQYNIINNDQNTVLPSYIEEKWIDSLCGKDKNGSVVPDPRLPAKLKYGIENRPRQSMFVNRFEALKQFIEGVNFVLKSYKITEYKDISPLDSYDTPPNILSGLYDTVKDTDYDLRFVNVGNFTKPVLAPQIRDGRITGVTILNSGSGFVNAPYISVIGDGKDARVKAKINALGQIIGVEILSSGEGYNQDSTFLSVRSYSVLVQSDSGSQNFWSIFSYDTTTQVWSRVQTQGYDVRPYWNYIDWYDVGYNQFIAVDHFINGFVNLRSTAVQIGEIVKIKTNNSGYWTLLERINDSNSIDYTQDYKTVGIQNGTIQFKPSIFNLSNTVYGYDGALYDDLNFDNAATLELRIILETLKKNILTGELRKNYLDLFFASVRYAISEQISVDWIFKTSFIKADHIIGSLDQTTNYKPDNLADYQKYIAEVKPYRTKIREYVDNYTSLEKNLTAVTDFDLPPVLENNQVVPVITNYLNDNADIVNVDVANQYPWKYWIDNHGYEVTELRIVDPGAGYFSAPELMIISASGSGAQAKAFINNGSIRSIVLLNKGKGYLSTPEVVVNGGFSDTGRPARIIATIGNGVVRSTHIGMKFDRLSKAYSMVSIEKTEQFVQNGTKVQFTLKWAPDLRLDTYNVTINGIIALKETYKLTTRKTKVNNITKTIGIVNFDTAPELNAVIRVNYLVNWNLLNASDRIQFYYNPEQGQAGKDLGQLMSGVDYGGAIVAGFDFKVNYGWDTNSSFNDVWDGEDSSFKDYIAIIDDDFDYKFTLPYTPEAGTELNVYYSEYFQELRTGDGIEKTFTFDARQQSPLAVITSQSEITLPNVIQFKGIGITITNVSGNGTFVTVSFATRTQPPFQTGDIINISGVRSVFGSISGFSYYNGLQTVFSATNQNIVFQGTDTAFYSDGGIITFVNKQVLDVSSTADIVPQMKILRTVSGTSKVIATVKSIINQSLLEIESALEPSSLAISCTLGADQGTTTLTFKTTSVLVQGSKIVGGPITFASNTTINIISSTQINISSPLLADVPSGTVFTFTYNPVPLMNENISVTFNAKGSQYLSLMSTDNIKVNDAISLVENTLPLFAVSTRVVEIQNSNVVKLSNILYENVISTYNAKISRDVQINPKISVAGVGVIELNEAPKIGETLTISSYLTPVRIDGDGNVMPTIVADGVSAEVEIPNTFSVNSLDKFIVRESTSDGSIEPLSTSFDTKLDGGNLAYTSATGLLADDIIVDGDGFVTPNTSYYPEEVVPGQIVDTLAIKVFDRPRAGSANVLVNTYKYETGSKVFDIGQLPNTSSAVIVKTIKDNNFEVLTAVTDYIVDYKNKSVNVIKNLDSGTLVSIYSLGYSGSDIIGFDYFIGNGSTKEFVTNVKYIPKLTAHVSVNGQVVPVLIFETDETYDSANRIGFRFIDTPPNQSLITYILISEANNQTFALTSKQVLEFDGNLIYELDNIVGNSLPNENNMIVRSGNRILNSPSNYYYTIQNNVLVYEIDPGLFLPNTVTADEVIVIANNTVLVKGVDYDVFPAEIRIVLYQKSYLEYENKSLVISINTNSDYSYIPPANKFDKPKIKLVKPLEYSDFEVMSFYKNDILDIKTQDINLSPVFSIVPNSIEYFDFRNQFAGIIKLNQPVLNENYVWVIRNGVLLTPAIDYILQPDYVTIKFDSYLTTTDRIKIITFSNNILRSGISYMQFKDMLNRTSYTRLSLNKQTKLAADLRQTDKTILVEDASNLTPPNPSANKPGIIEIRGERIEYFTLEGNVLGQLRRGTLGTGTPLLHKFGSYVQDIGTNETISYTDTTYTQQIVSSGTNLITNLNFVPANKDDIEVFVGGYNIQSWIGSTTGNEGKSYFVDDIVEYNGYTYKCKTNHVSSSSFADDMTNWEFFIANIRLNKNPYKVHNVNLHPYSPEGDVSFPADFSVDGTTNRINLTTPVDAGTVVTVVKRTGKDWDSVVNIMDDNSKIAQFLKATPGTWYTGIENYALTINTEEQFDNSDVTFDSSNYKVD